MQDVRDSRFEVQPSMLDVGPAAKHLSDPPEMAGGAKARLLPPPQLRPNSGDASERTTLWMTLFCAKPLEPKPQTHSAPLAGVIVVRCQFGTLTVKWVGLPPYDGSAGNTLLFLAKSKPDQPHHSATIRARQFGTKLRRQCGTNPQSATTPMWEQVRW